MATAVIVAYGGIRKALKDLTKTDGPGNVAAPGGPAVQSVVGGTIMETTTLLMWSESNRDTTEALKELIDRLESVIHCINYSTEAQRNTAKEVLELRHQVERLRDKMP